MQCFVRGRQRVNGKNGAGVHLGVRQTHLQSLTTFQHSCPFGHWRPDWKTISDTVSVRRSARCSLMLSSTWLDADVHFICPGLARKGNWHVIPSWGDWEGEGRGTVSMPKGPRGLPAMGFACLREWFHWRLHAWVWLCLPTSEFWSLRKQMGVGGGGMGED